MTRNIVLVLILIAIGGGIYFLESKKAERAPGADSVEVKPRVAETDTTPPDQGSPTTTPAAPFIPETLRDTPKPVEPKSKRFPLAKEITTPDGFINTDGQPVTIGQYVGKKVVLVDFWTYSCINCQRTTPYLNAWWDKYKDKGLVIIGVHTPEFDFEKIYDNVKKATVDEGIKYPVVLDNDFSTWTAYGNRFWPRKYLIDIDGYIVYDHIGEGAYDETEKKIQELLAERDKVLGLKDASGVSGSGIVTPSSAPGGGAQAATPEIYFGAARNSTMGNGVSGRVGEQVLQTPSVLKSNQQYLSGTWNFTDEYAESKSAGATITLKYTSKKVFFVASADTATSIQVKRDGQVVSGASGVVIKEARLYKLIEDEGLAAPTEHTLEIIVPQAGLKAFTFTFG